MSTNRYYPQLEAYLNSLAPYTPMPEAEQQRLIRLGQAGDQRARQQLIASFLRFAAAMAKRFVKSGVAIEDAVQEANLGLLEAFDGYDASRGVKFIAYAAIHVLRRLRGSDLLRQRHDIAISAKTQTKLARLDRLLIYVQANEDLLVGERIERPDDLVMERERLTNVEAAMRDLPAPEQTVLTLRLTGLPLRKIARTIGKSYAATIGLESRAILHMSRQLKRQGYDVQPGPLEMNRCRFRARRKAS